MGGVGFQMVETPFMIRVPPTTEKEEVVRVRNVPELVTTRVLMLTKVKVDPFPIKPALETTTSPAVMEVNVKT